MASQSGRAPFRARAMFSLFERLLKPTDLPEQAEPPPGFIAFFWHFARQAKGLFVGVVRRRLRGRAARFDHSGLHGPHRHPDHGEPAGRAVRDILAASRSAWRWCCWSRGRWRMTAQNLIANQAIAANVVEPHPLAEPLARGAPVLGVLPERLRRPHRQPRDADRAGDPRDAGRADHRASGTSWSTAPARSSCSAPPIRGWRCRSCCGSSAIW